jgi:tyrosine-protein phosphatase YwqE
VVNHLHDLGASVIVAHPERHAGADLHERLSALAGMGCLIQWTADFVLNAEPQDLVLRYARDGLVHLLASDAHSTLAGRPLRLSGGFSRLSEVCPAAWVHWMAFTAPRAIVEGAPLAVPW